jgi:transposase
MARPSILHDAFTAADRRRLARALSTELPARVYRRVAAVVEVADGEDVRDVARRLGVSRATIHRWVARSLARRQTTSLADGVRRGRPRRTGVSDRQLVRLLARDPRSLGYQSATWTAALLAAHCGEHYACPLHPRTLRRRLHALGYRWKRPRYRYAHRAAHLAQKKGLSAAA